MDMLVNALKNGSGSLKEKDVFVDEHLSHTAANG